MIITTTASIEGRQITKYLGVVSAAVIPGFGGGQKGVQRGWKAGVAAATEILAQEATELGANAVIAAHFELSGIYICATGTAVMLD
jgi:uncharacterized protein YbjQ (UPF0145 family)